MHDRGAGESRVRDTRDSRAAQTAAELVRAPAAAQALRAGATPAALVTLQRTVGNRATRTLMRQPRGRRGRARDPFEEEFQAAASLMTEAWTAIEQLAKSFVGLLLAPFGQPGQQLLQDLFRPTVVFLMGQDRTGNPNRFYWAAEHYWRLHAPTATFVTDQRTLADVIGWINANATQPVGRVVVVSHANENGTLSFGLDSSDTDAHLDFHELKEALHPTGGGSSTLPSPGRNLDSRTTIDIKGCDIGRSTDMLNLLREAFGGAQVIAPTHEQGYAWDDRLGGAARRQTETGFRTAAESHNPMPPPVDPALRGTARRDAVRARDAALRTRAAAIRAEVETHRREIALAAQYAGWAEQFSGPEIETPGVSRIAAADVRAQVDHLYPHLTDAERARLTAEMVRGERVETITPMGATLPLPASPAQVTRALNGGLPEHGRVTRVVRTTRVDAQHSSVDIVVRVTEPHQPPSDQNMMFTFDIPDDAALIADAQGRVSNPEHYQWDVVEQRGAGSVTRTARGRRMRAYLHHRSLNDAGTPHFDIPDESNPDFFGHSN